MLAALGQARELDTASTRAGERATSKQAREQHTASTQAGERAAFGQVQGECTVDAGFPSCTSQYHWSKSSVGSSARTSAAGGADMSSAGSSYCN